MADKPPLALKPPTGKVPLPKPRKKGPPPKPVPYHKHKEHKEHDVSTFKSNHPINKAAPPVPAEKPPRRYSAKGEPSAEFSRPKKVDKVPIQYTIPVIPGMTTNKEAKIDTEPDVRPRLDTPYVPPEPSELSNGTESKLEVATKEPVVHAKLDIRPRLDTPLVPPEPAGLINESSSKERKLEAEGEPKGRFTIHATQGSVVMYM